MADYLPLLVFPQARTIVPPTGSGFQPSKPHFPGHDRQVERLHDVAEYITSTGRTIHDTGGTQ